MTITVTHAKVLTIANDITAVNKGEVVPTDWNANHVVGSGSTDKAIIFDQAGVFGEDTNLEWDYTNHILNLGPNARLNSIGTTWRFDVGGTNVLDYGITNAGFWNTSSSGLIATNNFATGQFTYHTTGAATHASEPGLYVYLAADGSNRRFVAALDFQDNGFFGFGSGTTLVPDTTLFRDGAAGVLGLQNGNNEVLATGFRVYNTSDSVNQGTGPTANYERGVFDWTTTTNILTIGTQAGGSGTVRGINIVAGASTIANYRDSSFTWIFGSVNNRGGYVVAQTASGQKAGFFVDINTDVHARVNISLDASDNGLVMFGAGGGTPEDTGISRPALGTIAFGNGTGGDTSATLKAGQYIAYADYGGTLATNTLSNGNSTTIGAGTGTVKMSSANNANNTGWLKCYIGTQVAWIPCWTTNAP